MLMPNGATMTPNQLSLMGPMGQMMAQQMVLTKMQLQQVQVGLEISLGMCVVEEEEVSPEGWAERRRHVRQQAPGRASAP